MMTGTIVALSTLLLLAPRASGQAHVAAPVLAASMPEQQGIDSERLTAVFDYVHKEDAQIHSLLVIRNGHAVLDASFYPYDPRSVHDVASVTKTLVGTLVGIAIDKGFIKDVNQRVLDFFPGLRVANLDARKRGLTLDHVLSMQSALCHAAEDDGEAQLDTMRATGDWVQFVLDLPMKGEPGGRFAYCSASMQILSAVLTRATGTSALEFARKYLFEPLDIHDVIWPADPQGNNRGWGDCHLRPADLAKLALLFLNGGAWNGTEIVSKKWIEQATATHAKDREDDYGYLWWKPRSTAGMYDARGRGGQRVCVWPQKRLVVVMTGSGFRSGALSDLVFAAIMSDQPLPENTSAFARLQRAVAQAATPPPPRVVPPLPPLAPAVSGKRYVFNANALGFDWFSLTFPARDQALFRRAMRGGDRSGEAEVPVGLDGVYRISPTSAFGLPLGARGSWITDRDFQLTLDEAADNHIFRLTFHFEGDTAVCKIEENTGQIKATLLARAVAAG